MPLLRRYIIVLMFFAGSALAQADPNRHPNLYLDAMQAIAEGRKKDASDTLARMIEQEPEHAGAWLDLAILQCELGHTEKAEQLFDSIEKRFSPPSGIMDVITYQRTKGCAPWQPGARTLMSIGRGTDSNVNQGTRNPNFTIGSGDTRIELQLLPEYFPKRDSYTLLSMEYARDLNANGTIGFIQFQARHNDSLTEYNTASLAASVEHPWRIGNWGVRGLGTLAVLSLGGRLYQEQGQVQAQITPPLSLPDNFQLKAVAGLAHVIYPTLRDFNSNMWDIRGVLSYKHGQHQIVTSLGYLADRGTSTRPGGNRHGQLLSLHGRTPLITNTFGEFSWTHQSWRSDLPYSPGLIDQTRHQKTQTLRAAVIVPINNRHSLHFEWRETRNKENISIFEYDNRSVQLNWQWQAF